MPFLPFDKARVAAQNLKLKNKKEWEKWSKSGKRPLNIPARPDKAYRDAGWISMPDWLGYEAQRKRLGGMFAGVSFLHFDEARAAVRKLKLKSWKEWVEWGKSDKRPLNIPSQPSSVYRDAGWISWPDWLGYVRQSNQDVSVSFLPFEKARAAARDLKLKSKKEWCEWSKSGKRPLNIPARPDKAYRDAGWISYPDWLGYEGQRRGGRFLPFEMARAAVRKLKLKSWKEWVEWCKSGKGSLNIPSHPNQTYRDAGWISWPDWLGYEGRRRGGQHAGVSLLPFDEARAAARKLKLKSWQEWMEWCKSDKRPLNIPGNPRQAYRDAGWISGPDWLGYDRRDGKAPPKIATGRRRGKKRKCTSDYSGPAAQRPATVSLAASSGHEDDEEEEHLLYQAYI